MKHKNEFACECVGCIFVLCWRGLCFVYTRCGKKALKENTFDKEEKEEEEAAVAAEKSAQTIYALCNKGEVVGYVVCLCCVLLPFVFSPLA